MTINRLTFFLIMNILLTCKAGADQDLVTDLPDYTYKNRMYSGYLDVSAAKKFHYVYVVAHEDPEHKPLVLWLNGGPGCSSLDGFTNEHGPMTMNKEGNFVTNEYSWNRAANMLYLESPGDVGFSYIEPQEDYELEVNDEIAAKDNLKALLEFLQRFPTLKNHDFFISGESYAGIYVPTLAYNVIKYNEKVPASKRINLKGILVGNGVGSWKYDTNPATTDFAFEHILYSYETRKQYNEYCIKKKETEREKCEEIKDLIDKLQDGVNPYDYLQECQTPKLENGEPNLDSKYYLYARWKFPHLFKKYKNKQKSFKKPIFDDFILGKNAKSKNSDTPCIDDANIERYYNRDNVKAALHVKQSINWRVCSNAVSERYQRNDYASLYTYPTIIKAGVRILIFSGDTDMAVPFNGNLKWIKELNLPVVSENKSWRAFGDKLNVAGYRTIYKGLVWTTIKGTGHMVPQWKPKEAYWMFERFINDEDF